MLVRFMVGLAAFVLMFSPSERRYRKEQKRWTMYGDRPTMGRRDYPDIESQT
jgi:hypothetical protein